MDQFQSNLKKMLLDAEELITRTNIPQETSNGIFTRYNYPVLTAAHTPVFWR